MAIKNPTARSMWNFSLWWAKTGSNWFRSEHILKERSEAQNVVSRGCRRLYDCKEKKKKGKKKGKKKAPRRGARGTFHYGGRKQDRTGSAANII